VGEGSEVGVKRGRQWLELGKEQMEVMRWEEEGTSAAWVWVCEELGGVGGGGVGGVVAMVRVEDSPRKEATEVVRGLRGLGVECVMLTGDSDATARAGKPKP
jgi:cation transport ATPase